MMTNHSCEDCGEEFKSAQGLSGHRQLTGHGKEKAAIERSDPRKPMLASRPLPVDAIVERMTLPEMPDSANGYREAWVDGFNQGMKFGMYTSVAGVRLAQELSAVGNSQALPLIKMAQEMRNAEGKAAEGAVQSLLSQVMPYLEGRFERIEGSMKHAEPNPFQGMMARTLETLMGKTLGSMGQGGQPQGPANGSAPELPGVTWHRVSNRVKQHREPESEQEQEAQDG